MVEFGSWDMPIQYSAGIVQEHLATRKQAGLFDVSHMGRFIVRGPQVIPFLQYTLTNDAAQLKVGQSQYTIIPNESGGARDDAYLYRFREDEYLLVVNAANRKSDWDFFRSKCYRFDDVELIDRTHDLSMISLQGPCSQTILEPQLSSGTLPHARRNSVSIGAMNDVPVWIARTGYTGEPVCFELIMPTGRVEALWDRCCEAGATPVGLGARDTLRLEAGLPLYGHELGIDPEEREIPILAMRSSKIAVNMTPDRHDCIGKAALTEQLAALQRIRQQNYDDIAALPRRIVPIALTGKGIARSGNEVFQGERKIGFVTSGTMVPYWKSEGEGTSVALTDEAGKRAIGLALVDSECRVGDALEIDIRGRRTSAKIVASHLQNRVPPYAHAILP
jgi:aminomethyltransferase